MTSCAGCAKKNRALMLTNGQLSEEVASLRAAYEHACQNNGSEMTIGEGVAFLVKANESLNRALSKLNAKVDLLRREIPLEDAVSHRRLSVGEANRREAVEEANRRVEELRYNAAIQQYRS